MAENGRREKAGERPLYLMYDQVYWTLCFGDTAHVTPAELVPEVARYTIFVDGISKAFAATGVRVGWGVGPTDVIARMSAILGHMGAWAPRAEQLGTVTLLTQPDAIPRTRRRSNAASRRASTGHAGLQARAREGCPWRASRPGCDYLTAQFVSPGRRPRAARRCGPTTTSVRFLLEAPRACAVVPSRLSDARARISVPASAWARSRADIDDARPPGSALSVSGITDDAVREGLA